MRCTFLLVLIAAWLMVAPRVRAEPPVQELDRNQRLLERARQDPERYAHLLQNQEAFQALPPERQEALRALDRALHENTPAAAHLRRVLERYAGWLEQLPEADRRRIETSSDASARLEAIRQIRERQWEERLPKAYRDRLVKLQGQARTDQIAEWRQQEKKRRLEWQKTLRHRPATPPG